MIGEQSGKTIYADDDANMLQFPRNVKRGDLLLIDYFHPRKWWVPGPFNEHCALYLGFNESEEKHMFIHSSGNGVENVSWDYYSGDKNFWFGRVHTDNGDELEEGIIEGAIEWAISRLNDSFQDSTKWRIKENDPDKHYWPHQEKNWTCSEFVWAAYYNCNGVDVDREGLGIDIDRNGWNHPFNLWPYVYSWEIIPDDNTKCMAVIFGGNTYIIDG